MNHKIYLVTNIHNFVSMLTTGLVQKPSAKYYEDALNDSPGWIPFCEQPSTADLNKAVTNSETTACILEFDLSGYVVAPKESGSWTLPAPLPISYCNKVYFQNEAAKKSCTDIASDCDNILLALDILEVNNSLFKDEQGKLWKAPTKRTADDHMPHTVDSSKDNSREVQALGGVIAMLYHLSHRSTLALTVYQSISQPNEKIDNPILAQLPSWLKSPTTMPQSTAENSQLFWGCVNALAKDTNPNVIDVVLKYLKSDAVKTTNPEPLQQLISNIGEYQKASQNTLTDMLKQHQSTGLSALLLLARFNNCKDFLNDQDVTKSLEDPEILLTGILWGARTGWSGLPKDLRTANGLAAYIETEMAKFACAQHPDRKVTFARKNRPKSLREWFTEKVDDWEDDHLRVAKHIINSMPKHDFKLIAKAVLASNWSAPNIVSSSRELIESNKSSR